MHGYVLANAISTFLCFLLNSAILFLILSRGRKKYHYLFAAVLALYAIGNLSFFLAMIRNSYLNELPIYASVISVRLFLMVPCIYHFTCSYLNQPRKKSTIFIWVFMVIAVIFTQLLQTRGEGMVITHTEWGNFWTFPSEATVLVGLCIAIVFFTCLVFIWSACWFLFRTLQRETSPVARRHLLYILISFLVISFFFLTLFSFFIDLKTSLLLYIIRGLITAVFASLVGIAIIKERLFDITVIIKKTTIYSILLALIIFVFSFSEHMLATYVGHLFGGQSIYIHLISIAAVIAVLMPVRQRLERAIESFFAKKKLEF